MVKDSNKKERLGEVVSAKSAKTLVVQTSTRVPHAKFGKIVKVNRKFDVVRIRECRPMSALKRWELVEVLKN
jgi:small subunit ribosomal protein S17